ncbi:zinc-binding dehydrogenase [Chloroflexota bacterium]
MKRRLARLAAAGHMELIDDELASPTGTQVRIQVVAAGLCHSETPFFTGDQQIPEEDGAHVEPRHVLPDGTLDYPFCLGHEPVGIVEELGPGVRDLKPGDGVTGLGWVDGHDSFSSHILVREENLVKVPDGVRLEYALGEPLGCVVNIARIASPGFGDAVAVVGCGFMGLLVVAALAGTPLGHLIAIDLQEERLQLARGLGATVAFNPQEGDVAGEVDALTKGRGVDVAVEITGRAAGLELATRIIRERQAKVLLASVYVREPFDIGNQLMSKAPVLIAAHPVYSHEMTEDVRRGVWGYAQGLLPVERLVTHRFGLERIQEAMELSTSQADGYIKGIVTP